jgi:transcriptional regulator with XRE-family HTH domain
MTTGGVLLTETASPPEIGRRLGALRASRGLSQGTVARLASLSPSYLSRIENLKIHPTFPTVWRILRALNADVSDILDAEDLKRTPPRSCPITQGDCLLDRMRSEIEVARNSGEGFFSPREIRLLRELATWMKSAPAEKVRALELLLEALLSKPS